MIPELYFDSTTDFTENPVARLTDCTRCIVTEERNGIYEMEFDYPVSGAYFDLLTMGKIVCAVPYYGGDKQPFIIYQRSAEIGGIATFNAHHISYRLSFVIMGTIAAGSAADAMAAFEDLPIYPLYLPGGSYPWHFTFETNIVSSANFYNYYPQSIKSLLYGQRGSILDVYGGEFEYDCFHVILYSARGSDNGLTIRYGKNLVSLKDTIDSDYIYNMVVPYWYDEETNTLVYADAVGTGNGSILWTNENTSDPNMEDENGVQLTFRDGLDLAVPLDLSGEYDEQPTTATLRNKGISYLNSNTPWFPKRNIDIDFVDLSQTKEYEDIEDLEHVNLCDTVHIIYEQLGIVATSKVIKTEWNVLLDRYDKITVGDPIDDYGKYTGKVNIGNKTFNIVNGLITDVR